MPPVTSEDVKKVQEKYKEAMSILISQMPAIAGTILPLGVVVTRDIPTLATDGLYIYVNPDFASKLGPAELALILAHEGLHALLSHPLRIPTVHSLLNKIVEGAVPQQAVKELYNILADYVVNGIIYSNTDENMRSVFGKLIDELGLIDPRRDLDIFNTGIRLKWDVLAKKSVEWGLVQAFLNAKKYMEKSQIGATVAQFTQQHTGKLSNDIWDADSPTRPSGAKIKEADPDLKKTYEEARKALEEYKEEVGEGTQTSGLETENEEGVKGEEGGGGKRGKEDGKKSSRGQGGGIEEAGKGEERGEREGEGEGGGQLQGRQARESRGQKALDKRLKRAEELGRKFREYQKRIQEYMRKLVARSLAFSRAMRGSKSVGSAPGGVERFLEDLMNITVSLDKAIRRAVGQLGLSIETRAVLIPPNKKIPLRKGKKFLGIGRVWALVDTSGSISDELLGMFISALKSVMRKYMPQEILIVPWDATVYKPIRVKNRTMPKQIAGGGGTLPELALEYVVKKVRPGDIVVLMSDYEFFTGSTRKAAELINTIRKKGAPVVLVYYEGEANTQTLEELAKRANAVAPLRLPTRA